MYSVYSINYVVSVRGEGVKNCQFYLVKRRQRGGRGLKIADIETTSMAPNSTEDTNSENVTQLCFHSLRLIWLTIPESRSGGPKAI